MSTPSKPEAARTLAAGEVLRGVGGGDLGAVLRDG
jgi:hypothetical protein